MQNYAAELNDTIDLIIRRKTKDYKKKSVSGSASRGIFEVAYLMFEISFF
jgi:hypothetical protein